MEFDIKGVCVSFSGRSLIGACVSGRSLTQRVCLSGWSFSYRVCGRVCHIGDMCVIHWAGFSSEGVCVIVGGVKGVSD